MRCLKLSKDQNPSTWCLKSQSLFPLKILLIFFTNENKGTEGKSPQQRHSPKRKTNLLFSSLVPFLKIFVCLIELHFCLSVPFREAPSYSHRRRGLQSTLAAPRVLLRSNSDNNLNVNNIPEWSAASSSLHRSLSPQLLQQMQNNPNGTVKTIGSYSQVPRSRSPSLNRLGEDAKRQQHRHVRYALTIQ